MIQVYSSMIHAYSSTCQTIKVQASTFKGGEVQVKVGGRSYLEKDEELTVVAYLYSSDDVMALLLTVDALRRKFGSRVSLRLICPYLPYARQDRVMQPGEALSLKVFCDLINSLGFTSVLVYDVHSDVALALLDNVFNYAPSTFVQMIPVSKPDTILVAPDAGALKKVSKVASGLGFEMVRADKTRNTKDGSITGTVVYTEHVGDKDFLIVDDICDGGRTFIELAKELRKYTTGKILLYVTHGIFSYGLDPILEHIDHIYVALTFPGVPSDNPRLTRLMPTVSV